MKGKIALIICALLATLFSSPQAFSTNKIIKAPVVIKKAGRTSTSIPNTILSGNGIPAKTIGIDGDFYIDLKNANLYGPKTKGLWKFALSLRIPALPAINGSDGAKGNTGEQGATGSTGNTGANGAAGSSGPVGAQGEVGVAGNPGAAGSKGDTGNVGATGATGETGITGAKGDVGSIGSSGSTGARGETGLTGQTGLQGSPGTNGSNGAVGAAGSTGNSGSNGSTGARGETGLTGQTGLQGSPGTNGTNGSNGAVGAAGADGTNGSKGDTGDQGAAGISRSMYVEIGQTIVSTAVPGAPTSWLNFATLDALGLYTFELIYDGVFSSDTFLTKISLGLTLSTVNATSVFNYRVFSSDTNAYLDGNGGRHYQFLVIGTISTIGSNSLRLKIVDQLGLTGSVMVSFLGNALFNKVGSLG